MYPKNEEYIDIPIEQLGINPQYLVRPIDDDYVEELADTDESEWEPIEVRLWPDNWVKPALGVIYHVVSGNHRTKAAWSKGCSTIRGKVIDCPDHLSYLLAAIRTNSRHGRNFSSDEKRMLAAKLVAMGQSYKQIAQALGVSKATISGWITGNDSNASKKLKVMADPVPDEDGEDDELNEPNELSDLFETFVSPGRTKYTKKADIIVAHARDILEATNPMTVRQVFYQLVTRKVVGNSRNEYNSVSDALRDARLDGIIPWHHIEDRLRRPRRVSMWEDVSEFADAARRSYRRDVWQDQPEYLEVWLEKDALSGLFEDVLDGYGVTLNVGRGYDGWSSIYRAAKRFEYQWQYRQTILYFGDFDPTGEHIFVSLKRALARLNCYPEMVRVALTREQLDTYHLPTNPVNKKDSRAKAFLEKYGDISAELDALPVDLLLRLLRESVEANIDKDTLEATRTQEAKDKRRIVQVLKDVA
jgi:transposase-like protein